MRYLFLLIAATVFLGGCTNQEATERTLSALGFTDINTHGWALLSCGEDDFYSTKFTATSAQGQFVDGAVCCGLLFKNCMVRF